MVLSDNDLEKIGKIVDDKVSGLEMKMTREFGSLRLEMNQRFDEADVKNTREHQKIIQKIEQVKQMETEDVEAIATDVLMLKKKISYRA